MTLIRPEERTTDNIYDSCAKSYGYDISSSLSARLKYELATKFVCIDDQVLDIGCANGIHMRVLAPLCRHITGVDINEAMLQVAQTTIEKEGIKNSKLERRSAANLGFKDGSFDLVYSFSTLLMVPNIEQALSEISRVLRPNGVALLDLAGRYNLSRLYWGFHYKTKGHFGVHSFSYPKIAKRLSNLGLEVIETHALGFADQWRYVPGLHWLKQLDKLFHGTGERDLDYKISNLPGVFRLANRWYVVCRKTS